MKNFSLFILSICLFTQLSFGQEGNRWMGNSKLTISYLHLGSYIKENPLIFIDQSFEYVVKPKFRVGLGLGFNLYPADVTVPIFADFKYITELKRCGFFAHQTYGYNLKLGDVGFFSHRLTGGVGLNIRLGERLTLDPELGYVMNLDNYGGGSLSFVGSIGLYYPLTKK